MRGLLARGGNFPLQQLVPRRAGRQEGRARNRHQDVQGDHYDVTGVEVRAADAAAQLGGVCPGSLQQERPPPDRPAQHEAGERQRQDSRPLRVSLSDVHYDVTDVLRSWSPQSQENSFVRLTKKKFS